MKRFASHSEEDMIAKRQNLVPTNTVKANKAASNLFRSYLEEKNMDSVKRKYFCFSQPRCYCFWGPK
jgi:hypothetical protein